MYTYNYEQTFENPALTKNFYKKTLATLLESLIVV